MYGLSAGKKKCDCCREVAISGGSKWKDWVTNVAKIARITNLTKYYT